MATRFGVRGGKELASALRELGKVPSAPARRRARSVAGEVIADAYRENLRGNGSEVTGALIASIDTAQDPTKAGRTLVGARNGKFKGQRPASYSHFPEFGTAPHWQPNRFGGIMHPGARPKPALRPAYESNKDEAAKAYFDQIAAEVREAAARIASRSGGRR